MKTRTLIVDDEPLARERLRKLLEKESDIELLGECADGREAVTRIKETEPDLVFLDVQMPECNGFDVLAQLRGSPMPVVVFVTAYDQFALKAFEVHAVDYLLKPFDRERFQTALRRALDHVRRSQAGELNARLSALLGELKSQPKHLERLAIKSSGRLVLIRIDDVDWVESSDNYVELHVGTERHLHRVTMSALEEMLPPERFMRISRSAIVNVDRIKELQPLFHGEYVVTLRDGKRLTLSRSYREKLRQILGKED
jgi:two-component system LytT family response regulator